MATDAIPGLAIGSMTWKNLRHSPAPSISAASAISSGRALKNGKRKNTVNGSANAT